MTQPITNTYRAQNLKAAISVLRDLKKLRPSERDEIIRVLEDMVERLQADARKPV